MAKWKVTGTRYGKVQTVTVDAADYNAAVRAGSMGKNLLVVRDCVLVDDHGEGCDGPLNCVCGAVDAVAA